MANFVPVSQTKIPRLLAAAAVIKTAQSANADAARQTVGHLGAPIVSGLLPHGGIVALGGGRSVAEVARRFRRSAPRRGPRAAASNRPISPH